jgi:anaerobic C4-dicarboxylate transporter DcuA
VDWRLILEFLVIVGSLAMGARMGGVGLGLWGYWCLSLASTSRRRKIPGEVLLIVLTVIMAASAMEVAGGINFLVRVAERIIRKTQGRPFLSLPAMIEPRCSRPTKS